MKKIFLLFICFSFGKLWSQTVTSICSLNDTIAYKYKKDADRLAIRRAYHINSTYEDSIKVNKTWSNTYLKALIAVYNATTLPARDTVVKLCNIHTKADPDIRTFFISADSNLIWMKNLRYNVSPTGNSTVDYLVNKYNLQKIQFNAWNFMPTHDVIFKTDTSINSLPLSDAVFTLQGVSAAGPYASPFDGPNIVDSINTNFTQLIYYYGWTDCALGCINQRFWTFKVYNDCSVEYMGSYGDALPADVGIKTTKPTLDGIITYPNPVKDQLSIEFSALDLKDLKLNITNTLGQIIYNTEVSDRKLKLDLSSISNGVYFIYVQNNVGQKIFKIVKD